MEEILVNAYTQGGIGVVVVILLVWGIRWFVKQMKDLSNKVDELRTEVTDLKVQNAKWWTAIKTCEREGCPNKQLLEGKL